MKYILHNPHLYYLKYFLQSLFILPQILFLLLLWQRLPELFAFLFSTFLMVIWIKCPKVTFLVVLLPRPVSNIRFKCWLLDKGRSGRLIVLLKMSIVFSRVIFSKTNPAPFVLLSFRLTNPLLRLDFLICYECMQQVNI